MSRSAPTFASLSLPPELLANLDSLGFSAMTAIQAQSLPLVLAGQDVIAQAKTGSGKTAAFGLGMLLQLNLTLFKVQGMVLCPTRELADQVAKELRRLGRHLPNLKILTLCGGTPLGPQAGSLEHGAHLVVGTPGRIQDHLHKGTLDLARLRMLVLDEADRMLDMGFAGEVDDVISFCPARRQTLLFSATYPEEIRQLSASVQRDAAVVTVEALHDAKHIEQQVYAVKDNGEKPALLKAILAHYQPASTVVFCNTKVDCQQLADALRADGYAALALHGDLEQRDRDLMLVRFANGSSPILVATDMAARGLDIKDLAAVVNYELPYDPEVYVHRIGRTGRAGKHGYAFSLVSPSQAKRQKGIEAYLDYSLPLSDAGQLNGQTAYTMAAGMATLCLAAGRKQKLRPGDVLGALTGDAGLPGSAVGKIDLYDFQTFVAVSADYAQQALARIEAKGIKGKPVKARLVD
ncbi:ATP-dependent RNA helicase DbpA [Chitinolyticbacter meiyuanensis]|uniref:ATP-dependent RNA helicase DbpA n=1 Tax=Chitinolyticbacter meiyuanensis TaxID=682798 RepID=UPI0011E5D5F0|nr:ATP-dependent RNA helicase DbpA [Chitinolyticbacter meiyuanensis]